MVPDEKDILVFLETVKSISDYDFSNYSMNSLKRRVHKLTNDNHIDVTGLIKKIETDNYFLEEVVKKITVNTTELFRNPLIWNNLRDNILPEFREKPDISIWHAGCSTGQEVYSMIILLNEMELLHKCSIFASDINTDVLEKAKNGIYKYRFNQEYLKNFDEVINSEKNGKEKIPYSKYFEINEAEDTIIIKKQYIEEPEFRKTDLVKIDRILNKSFDIIICRNVIIYFNYDLQNNVFDMFHRNMNPGACLVLGIHESIIGPYANYFEKRNHVYYKKEINY